MRLIDVQQYREDLCKAAESLDISFFRRKDVLITGATGLICSAVVDLLYMANQEFGLDAHVYVAGRNEEKATARFDLSNHHITFIPYEATKAFTTDISFDYIIHGAGNASPQLYTQQPVETINGNIIGINNLLEYLHNKGSGRLLYISSSEVYGNKSTIAPFKEDDCGHIDRQNVRASYPLAKCTAEALCTAYWLEYHVDTVVVRPGHIYGPTASRADQRISSDFAYRAAAGEPLIMKSSGTQRRSYCYCLDCASAILTVLAHGESGTAYNISNSDSIISIREMAEIFAAAGGSKLLFSQPNSIEELGFNPMDNSSLNADRLEAIGWRGLFNAQVGLRHTVEILRELEK